MGYIINGVNTLFTRFTMVDFEADTYQYLAGTAPENKSLAASGKYGDFARHLCALVMEGEERLEFEKEVRREAVMAALEDQEDIRLECHVLRGAKEDWEHLNIICLERKEGRSRPTLSALVNLT